MYSEIIKKSAVFSSSDIFQTMNDIRVYKSRITYLEKLWNKFENYEFSAELHRNMHENFKNQMIHIASCGSFLTFRTLESDNTVGKLSNGSFCRQRICPLCQRRRSLKLFSNIQQMLEPIKNKYAFLHLTLTVPNVNVADIRSQITHLFESSKMLFNTPAIKKAFKGVIRSLEVTYNKDTELLHPHLHCLVLVNKSYFTSRDYIKFEDLREIWGDIIGVCNPQIHIRKCDDLVSALREVVKYASKPIDTHSEDIDGFDDFQALLYYMYIGYALKSRRLLQCFGICAELSKAFHIDLNNDEIEPATPEYTQPQYYCYNRNTRKFENNYSLSEETSSPDYKNSFHNQQLKIIHSQAEERKREKIRHNADYALKVLMRKKNEE